MSGGRFAKAKGDRLEREIVDLLRSHGLKAQRVPLSGAAGGSFTSDVVLTLQGKQFRIEAKHRGNGFQTIYSWLGNNDGLVIRADRQEPLICLPLKTIASLFSTLKDREEKEVSKRSAEKESVVTTLEDRLS